MKKQWRNSEETVKKPSSNSEARGRGQVERLKINWVLKVCQELSKRLKRLKRSKRLKRLKRLRRLKIN